MLALRRLSILPALLTCSALFLTGCGNSNSSSDPLETGKTYDRLDAVSISGDVGTAPKVTWKGQMTAGKIETKTLTEGDGDQLKSKDNVLAQIWVGDGYSQQQSFSTYEQKKAELITVDDQLPSFLKAVQGAKIGSRLAITSSAQQAFGAAGNSQLGIANKDTVLVIVDLISKAQDKPEGTTSPAPAWMPKLQLRHGVPTAFDVSKAPTPTDALRKVQLIKGTGPRVKNGQTVAVRYLGQAFGGDKPFDENFGDTGTGQPTAFGIGAGQVIKGWDQGLVGVPVGSRVVLEVPPELGYGAAGQPDHGIPANATLVFVIDVLAAA